MGLTNRKRYPNTAARRKMAPGPGASAQITRRTPIVIGTIVPGDTTTITFDQGVSLTGIPQYVNNAGHMPLTAVLTGPAELTLTYPAPDTTTSITVPFEDPAVRNQAAGYVLPGTFSGD